MAITNYGNLLLKNHYDKEEWHNEYINLLKDDNMIKKLHIIAYRYEIEPVKIKNDFLDSLNVELKKYYMGEPQDKNIYDKLHSIYSPIWDKHNYMKWNPQ